MNNKTNGEYRFSIEYYIFREGDNLMREFGITLLITLSEKKKVIIRNFVSLQLKTKILKRNEPYDYR